MKTRYRSFEWRGRTAHAFEPIPLRDRTFELSEPVVRATERAIAELRLMDQAMVGSAEPIGRLLLRSEGIASSAIEGLAAPLADVLTVEAIGVGAPAATWVSQNLDVVTDALEGAAGSLTAETIHGWHRQLMAGSALAPALHGAWRPEPGWIGGSSPLDAAFVPPLPDSIADLMDDLLEFVHGTGVDPITQAAVAHAQFETIHPYGDGNGRIGRVLAGWILRHRRTVAHHPPPLSVTISRDAGGYLAGLHEFRDGDPARWIEWFAARTEDAASAAGDLHRQIADLLGEWRLRLSTVRTDSAAHCALGLLPTFPIISANRVATDCGVSTRSALNALETLADRDILAEFEPPRRGRGRPARWWIADELVSIVRRWLG